MVETERRLFKHQKRIYKASLNQEKQNVKLLQKRMVNSLDAKLCAVKRVLKPNQNRITPYHADQNKPTCCDSEKMKHAQTLNLDGKAHANLTLSMVKPVSYEQRRWYLDALIRDQAKQSLVSFALEPAWEAKFKMHRDGFRLGHNCHDAISKATKGLKPSFQQCRFDPPSKAVGNFEPCFDNIDIDYVLNKLESCLEIQVQVEAWLKAGMHKFFTKHALRSKNLYENTKIQKRCCYAWLTSLVCEEIQTWLNLSHKPFGFKSCLSHQETLVFINTLNHFVFIHSQEEILFKTTSALKLHLSQTCGVELKPKPNSKMVCSTNGFSFLGFRFITILNGNKTRLKVYPCKLSVKNVNRKMGRLIRKNRSLSTYDLILKLKPNVLGWCHYFRICRSNAVFNKMDHTVFNMLRAWVFRRDKRNNRNKVKLNYFPNGKCYVFQGQIHHDNWILVGKKKNGSQNKPDSVFLPRFSWTKQSLLLPKHWERQNASIYDDKAYTYWTTRK